MTLLSDWEREVLLELRKISAQLPAVVEALNQLVLTTRRQAQALEYRNLHQADKVRAAAYERAKLLRQSKEVRKWPTVPPETEVRGTRP